jgi:HK97 family phage prohead protease
MPREPRVLTRQAFLDLVERGERPPDDAILRKCYVAELKQVAGDDRAVQFTISTATVDRDSDSLAVNGWKLDNYRKNNVVLFSHDYRSLPVARATKVWVEDQRLKSIAHFAERELYPFADTVFQMVKGGYLNATSVGFFPLKFVRVEGNPDRPNGVEFIAQELLEYSVVPVPSNPEALVEAKLALRGADWKSYRVGLERVLDTDGGRADVAAAWRILSPTSVSVPGRRASADETQRALADLLAPFRPTSREGLLLALQDPQVQAALLDRVGEAIDRAVRLAQGRVE